MCTETSYLHLKLLMVAYALAVFAVSCFNQEAVDARNAESKAAGVVDSSKAWL